MENIGSLVRKLESEYQQGDTKISEYVSFDLKNTIDTIESYLNSKHTSGLLDSMNREKPFFNIVVAARNIWMRATKIDRKDIRIEAKKNEQIMMSFIVNAFLSNWMNKSRFGMFLSDWGRTLASYGSAVVKFVEKQGELHIKVVPWNTLIVDTIKFEHNPVIEKMYLTPAQLRENLAYDQELVEKIITSKTGSRSTISGTQRDKKTGYIEVYEVHGELPLAYLTDNWYEEGKKSEDSKTYQQQMHVISFVSGKENGQFDDYTLYAGREKRNPYVINHLIKEEGRSLSIGAVETLFESQWMANHSAKLIKDRLDLASKLIFQTSDGNFMGRNALTNIETGDIMVTAKGEPLSVIGNESDIAALQSYGKQWQDLAKEITATPEAMRGNPLPANTGYSLGAMQQGQAETLFDLMTENKGIYLEDMLREYILPYVAKQLNHNDEISATLESYEIKQIDNDYIPKLARKLVNKKIQDNWMSGNHMQSPDMGAIQSQLGAKFSAMGNKRYFTPSDIKSGKKWSEIFKDFIWDCRVSITNEEQDKKMVLTTLSTVLQTIASNPGILNDPNAKLVFNRILETAGSVSPIELEMSQPQQQNQPKGKVNKNLSYKDAPEDIKRQIEQAAGLQPSQQQQPQMAGSGAGGM